MAAEANSICLFIVYSPGDFGNPVFDFESLASGYFFFIKLSAIAKESCSGYCSNLVLPSIVSPFQTFTRFSNHLLYDGTSIVETVVPQSSARLLPYINALPFSSSFLPVKPNIVTYAPSSLRNFNCFRILDIPFFQLAVSFF